MYNLMASSLVQNTSRNCSDICLIISFLYRAPPDFLCSVPLLVYLQGQLAVREAWHWEESTSVDSRHRSVSHTWCHLCSGSDLASSCVNTETITWRDANKCKFSMIIITKGRVCGSWVFVMRKDMQMIRIFIKQLPSLYRIQRRKE
jgi:hypothetical protein